MSPLEYQKIRDDLDARIALVYATNRPLLAKSFAVFVYRQGSGAKVPMEIDGKKVRKGGMTWQALGRELYGQDFVAALKALVDADKAKK